MEIFFTKYIDQMLYITIRICEHPYKITMGAEPEPPIKIDKYIYFIGIYSMLYLICSIIIIRYQKTMNFFYLKTNKKYN